ncbi:hypothetical protein [Hyphomonas sp.]|uniref:hypothetical protein n=1 Tax=Hyphomonas sp. TaxID=87 RepID=UPI000C8D74DE|nr:hypothetical protein [Hyphomonas sp.]MAL44333.1 hypothetical protein [Hyphomonas sp.]
MRKIKLPRNRKGDELMPYVLSKDGRHEVVAPVSSVRIGETNRNAVKSRHCVDYPRWIALFVGRSEAECKKWLDKYKTQVLKLCIPYEVS